MLTLQERAELDRQVEEARLRMLFEPVPAALAASAAYVLVVAALMHGQVPNLWLSTWLVVKLIVLLPRLVQARRFLASKDGAVRDLDEARRRLIPAMVLDGLVWGLVYWGLMPAHHDRDLALIAIGSLTGVAATSAFLNAMDTRVLACFLVPMLLPNVLYLGGRLDALGLFGAGAMVVFLGVMLVQALRSERRVGELLRLRFTTERVAADRARALEQARHHSDAKSRFLATVSHEMRTPLHGILGLARVLQQEAPRTDQGPRLTLIERSAEHLLGVINDILDFSKIEAGHMVLDQRAFDLTALLQESADVFQVLAQGKGLSLRLAMDWQGPCEVQGDPGRVRQVLHNLLGNAVKFTEQGAIGLHARCTGEGRFRLEVHDTGAGIAPHEQERIFEAFLQASAAGQSAHARAHPGTGLGLSIARQLCQAMGGGLWCDSTVGQGSVFMAELVLPAAPARDAAGQQGGARSAVPTGEPTHEALALTVLLVEDNPVNVLVAEAVLGRLGCRVSTVGDGQAALDWLEGDACDVVLMDWSMPVMDGFAATRAIRGRERETGRPRVPVIAVTANLCPTDRQACEDAGMDGYLAKPFSLDDLRAVLQRAMPRPADDAPLPA